MNQPNPQAPDHPELFTQLRNIVQPYMTHCHVKTDKPGDVHLETQSVKPAMFTAIMARPSGVSFYYMPVYEKPELRQKMPTALSQRMNGKSCFKFVKADDPAIAELKAFVTATATGFLDHS